MKKPEDCMRSFIIPLILTCAASTAPCRNARAQEFAVDTGRPATETISVLLDCRTFVCDFDHFRREISFVNWVRDRRDAQVHVLGTDRETGGGGREHALVFIGAQQFAEQVDTLTYVSSGTDTDAEIRDGLVHTVKLGLVRYVAKTPVAEHLAITYQAPVEGAPAGPVEDRWNLWVFTINVGGNLSGESQQRFFSGNGTVQANRTGEDLKLDFRVSTRLSRSETDVPELDTTFVNTQERFSFDALAVKSLGGHWSAGVRTSAASSNFINTDFSVQGGPAIEYSVYPYFDSTRRQLTLLYTVGVVAFDYEEETVFGVTSEVRSRHVLEISLAVLQPWGSVNTSLQASQFLHDLSKHRIDLFGGVTVRLFRELNLNFFGGASRVKDQLFISGAGLTPEERLLRTRQFETDFVYFGTVGFSYRFGSKFANVVNPRMSGGGGL